IKSRTVGDITTVATPAQGVSSLPRFPDIGSLSQVHMGCAPIHMAVKRGMVSIVKRLRQMLTVHDMLAIDAQTGLTALHLACIGAHPLPLIDAILGTPLSLSMPQVEWLDQVAMLQGSPSLVSKQTPLSLSLSRGLISVAEHLLYGIPGFIVRRGSATSDTIRRERERESGRNRLRHSGRERERERWGVTVGGVGVERELARIQAMEGSLGRRGSQKNSQKAVATLRRVRRWLGFVTKADSTGTTPLHLCAERYPGALLSLGLPAVVDTLNRIADIDASPSATGSLSLSLSSSLSLSAVSQRGLRMVDALDSAGRTPLALLLSPSSTSSPSCTSSASSTCTVTNGTSPTTPCDDSIQTTFWGMMGGEEAEGSESKERERETRMEEDMARARALVVLLRGGASLFSYDEARETPIHKAAAAPLSIRHWVTPLIKAALTVPSTPRTPVVGTPRRERRGVARASGLNSPLRGTRDSPSPTSTHDSLSLFALGAAAQASDTIPSLCTLLSSPTHRERESDVREQLRGLAGPVELAWSNHYPELAAVLLEGGAGLGHRNCYDQTLLHLAASRGDLSMVNLLLSHMGLGAGDTRVSSETRGDINIDAVDVRGRTALHMGARQGFGHVVQTLLEAGASPFIRDSRGVLPCQDAHIRCQSLFDDYIPTDLLDTDPCAPPLSVPPSPAVSMSRHGRDRPSRDLDREALGTQGMAPGHLHPVRVRTVNKGTVQHVCKLGHRLFVFTHVNGMKCPSLDTQTETDTRNSAENTTPVTPLVDAYTVHSVDVVTGTYKGPFHIPRGISAATLSHATGGVSTPTTSIGGRDTPVSTPGTPSGTATASTPSSSSRHPSSAFYTVGDRLWHVVGGTVAVYRFGSPSTPTPIEEGDVAVTSATRDLPSSLVRCGVCDLPCTPKAVLPLAEGEEDSEKEREGDVQRVLLVDAADTFYVGTLNTVYSEGAPTCHYSGHATFRLSPSALHSSLSLAHPSLTVTQVCPMSIAAESGAKEVLCVLRKGSSEPGRERETSSSSSTGIVSLFTIPDHIPSHEYAEVSPCLTLASGADRIGVRGDTVWVAVGTELSLYRVSLSPVPVSQVTPPQALGLSLDTLASGSMPSVTYTGTLLQRSSLDEAGPFTGHLAGDTAVLGTAPSQISHYESGIGMYHEETHTVVDSITFAAECVWVFSHTQGQSPPGIVTVFSFEGIPKTSVHTPGANVQQILSFGASTPCACRHDPSSDIVATRHGAEIRLWSGTGRDLLHTYAETALADRHYHRHTCSHPNACHPSTCPIQSATVSPASALASLGRLLRRTPYPDSRTFCGETALFCACSSSSTASASLSCMSSPVLARKTLPEGMSDRERERERQREDVHAERVRETVELFLAAGADPDAVSAYHESPLFRALQVYNSDIVSMLVRHGARIDLPLDNSGTTVLHRLCELNPIHTHSKGDRGRESTLEADGDGVSTLSASASNPRLSPSPVSLDDKEREGEGEEKGEGVPAEDTVVETGDAEREREDSESVSDTDGDTAARVSLLLYEAQGIDTQDQNSIVNALSNSGTPLHIAIKRNMGDVVSILLRGGASLKTCGPPFNEPALHYAARHGSATVVKLLITRILSLCLSLSLSPSLSPSLMYRHGSATVVKLLITAGANVDTRDLRERTALHVACERGDPAVLDALLSYHSSMDAIDQDLISPLHILATSNNHKCLKVVSARGQLIPEYCERLDVNHHSPISLAVLHKSLEALVLMLRTGASPDPRRTRLPSAVVPLHIALSRGDDERTIRSLLEAGASTLYTNDQGEPSLSMTCEPWIRHLLFLYCREEAGTSRGWVQDKDASLCMLCHGLFNAKSRRHHCRHCGRVMCDACSVKKVDVPRFERTKVRVCQSCFNHDAETGLFSKPVPVTVRDRDRGD
ncbi:hypothetical protein KIPB_003687, partial [Kipferlia bialata]